MTSNLFRRVIVAAVGIPAAFGVVYAGGWLLVAVVGVLGVAGTAEVYRLAAMGGVRPARAMGLSGAAALPVLVYLATALDGPRVGGVWLGVAAAAWLMLIMTQVTVRYDPTERPLAVAAVTLFGALYAGGMPTFLIVLRHGSPYTDPLAISWLVFLPLVVTWVTDTAAMAAGAAFGGPKLAPILSPNKTWAGAVGGTLGALVAAPVFGAVALAPAGIALTWWQLVALGAVVAVVGQSGDVAESLLKREVGAKDSGRFFPGHGGVLDRLDSLYWVLPATVALLKLYGVL